MRTIPLMTRTPYNVFTPRVGKTLPTPQSQPIFGEIQVKNNAGGFVYQLDSWKQLERFLILGTEGGTYYVGERKLTLDGAKSVQALVAKDGLRVVRTVVEISEKNRAPKSDPALFVLALAITYGDAATKRSVVQALPRVARIGTHLFTFIEYATSMRGWGRVLRQAVANWYTRHGNSTSTSVEDEDRNAFDPDTVS